MCIKLLGFHGLVAHVGQGEEEYHQHHEHIAHAEQERSARHHELEGNTEDESTDGCYNSSYTGSTFPQQAQTENDYDTRINEAGVFLDNLECLVSTTHDGIYSQQCDYQ